MPPFIFQASFWLGFWGLCWLPWLVCLLEGMQRQKTFGDSMLLASIGEFLAVKLKHIVWYDLLWDTVPAQHIMYQEIDHFCRWYFGKRLSFHWFGEIIYCHNSVFYPCTAHWEFSNQVDSPYSEGPRADIWISSVGAVWESWRISGICHIFWRSLRRLGWGMARNTHIIISFLPVFAP